MNTYIDRDYLIAKDTIITYTGNSNNIDVPGNFDEIRILKIGHSAFSELTAVNQIKLPYGVEHIENMAFKGNFNMHSIKIPGTVKHFGDRAFSQCNQLRDIIIYDIKLDKNTYKDLKAHSIKAFGDIYISRCIPKFISDTGFTGIDNTPAVIIPENIPVLFRFDGEQSGCNRAELFTCVDHFSFSETDNLKTEHAAFISQINSGGFEGISHIAETANDFAAKSENPLQKEKTHIFTFDDTKTKEKDENIYITATIKVGFFFWQSCQKVILNKTDYYVYRRLFLSSKEDIEFVKEDAAIYRGTELVQDRKEAQRVYGKYKLLSIL